MSITLTLCICASYCRILICIIHLMRKGLQAGVSSTLYGHGRFTTRLLSISNLKLQIVKKEISKDLRKLPYTSYLESQV